MSRIQTATQSNEMASGLLKIAFCDCGTSTGQKSPAKRWQKARRSLFNIVKLVRDLNIKPVKLIEPIR